MPLKFLEKRTCNKDSISKSFNTSTKFHAETYLKKFGWKGYGHGLRDGSLVIPYQLPLIKKSIGYMDAWWIDLFNKKVASLNVGLSKHKNKSDKPKKSLLYTHFVLSKENNVLKKGSKE
ncbi:hypothetical protein PNEG_00881 [Pneumocystis murina B123]|uniref:G-patch domain-containing protein n=1 Tax=Pneumocystis murina (strain B123) TaxID=1069680 RepID=M7NTZ0_PNEMU|nr:hypothetical protein PNEG_00881 [Pneumocystis murina B123]EMR10732.1 hypothetical protein PNEG_00881 [Pneumocystis murina B123]